MRTYSGYIFLATLVAVFYTSCWDGKDLSSQYQVEGHGAENTLFRVKNTGDHQASFMLNINDGFCYSLPNILSNIQTISEHNHEPLEMAAWRFVKDRTVNEQPLTSANWQHQPEIFINSIGVGYCNDEATILATLWDWLGFKSRIWVLEGHVVPEVFANGRWQMMDPSLKVFYLNEDGLIAGVDELANHPEYVLNVPDSIIPEDPFINAFCRSGYIAGLYASTNDNQISEDWKDEQEFMVPIFSMPAGSEMVFPGYFLPLQQFKRQYAQLKLVLPAGTKGMVEMPLQLEKITGNGTVSIAGREYEIGSEALDQLLQSKPRYINRFNIVRASDEIVAYFLINPLSIPFKEQNEIELNGAGLKGVTVFSEQADSQVALRYAFPSQVADSVKKDYYYYTKAKPLANDGYFQFSKQPITGPFTFEKKLNIYLDLDQRLSDDDKKEARQQIIEGISTMGLYSADSAQVVQQMNEPQTFVLIVSVMKYMFPNPEEE